MDKDLQDLFDRSEPFGAAQDEVAGATLLDVRRGPAFAAARQLLPGAAWRDPERLAQWLPDLADLPPGRLLVVYCVHGHEVSRGAVLRLRAAGHDARFLRGGFAGWQQAGLPLVDKPAG